MYYIFTHLNKGNLFFFFSCTHSLCHQAKPISFECITLCGTNVVLQSCYHPDDSRWKKQLEKKIHFSRVVQEDVYGLKLEREKQLRFVPNKHCQPIDWNSFSCNLVFACDLLSPFTMAVLTAYNFFSMLRLLLGHQLTSCPDAASQWRFYLLWALFKVSFRVFCSRVITITIPNEP